jgi:hypothetical protein
MTEVSSGLLGSGDGRPVEANQIAEETDERSPIGRSGMNIGDLSTLWDEVSGSFLVVVWNGYAHNTEGFRMGAELVVCLANTRASTEGNGGSEEEEVLKHNKVCEPMHVTRATLGELVFCWIAHFLAKKFGDRFFCVWNAWVSKANL